MPKERVYTIVENVSKLLHQITKPNFADMKKLLFLLGVGVILFACNSSSDTETKTDEKPADTPAPQVTVSNEKGLELIGASGCTTCHAIDKKITGPAYIDVAKKYETTDAIKDSLVNKIIKGGVGNWGTIPMPPNTAVTEPDVRLMVDYILSLDK